MATIDAGATADAGGDVKNAAEANTKTTAGDFA
jgi:hypothetical protein